ncbi:FG-GAP repeat domain-containing protein [Streptomyces sp. NPDC059835]|uniref:FG-GAP repeat domain-containing protein n=1 Tax=Streptomyces sp. NPDC059835 TaxID=3346967 RepID=UPI00364DF4E0
MNHRRAGRGLTRPLAALLAMSFPLTVLSALAAPAAAADEPATVSASDPGHPAASEVRAFNLAKTSGKGVEIIDRRTEYSETYALPDGNLTQRQSTLPIWTRHGSVWRRTDATVTRHDDGTLGPTSSFGIAFSQGGDGPLVAMDRSGKKLALTWPGRLPEPVVEGNTALYKSVLPGVDLKLIAEVNGFAQHLLVTTPEAAANPALKTIKLGVTSDGVTLDDDAADRLLAKDAAGNVVFSAPKPKMWEQPTEPQSPAPTVKTASAATSFSSVALAANTEAPDLQHAPVAADVTGNTLTLTPDPALLASADQFPLVIDPVFTGGYTEKWATVYSATPDADYPWGSGWNSSNPPDEPRVGYNGSGDTQSFFAMNTNGLKGSTILDATFAVEQTHSYGCDASAAGPTELWTAKDITTTPTWNTRNNYWGHWLASGNFAHGNPTYCPGVEGYDFKSSGLTAYVQEGADKGWDPLVFGLRVPNSYLGNINSFKRLRNNPVLEITYNFPPSVYTAGAFEGSWAPDGEGNKPVPCGATIGNSGLALTATLLDWDGGTVTPEFVVTKSGGASVPVSNVTTVPNGGTATATVLAANLATGSYTWKVRAKDGEGPDSAFTADCAFTVDKTGPAPVTVTKENGTTLTGYTHQARTPLRIKLKNPATDLAGFCYSLDRPLSVSGAPCSWNTWVPLVSGATETVIEVVPTGVPQSTLNVIAYDKAGNHSSTDGAADTTVIKTSPSSFVYPAGQSPLIKTATKDLHGDLNGDGFTDILATESNGLRFYAGDGTGKVKTAQSIGTGGWGDALIAHGGDYANLTSPTLPPDGYEDSIVRLNNNKLYVYPGNGLGRIWYPTRHELAPPSDLGPMGWGRFQQIIAPGDIDQRTDTGFQKGNDLVAIECVDDACASARLRIYSGRTSPGGLSDQTEPFEVQEAGFTSYSTWKNYTILGIGDQNGDGVKDLLSRSKIDGNLYLYPGQIGTDGKYSLAGRTLYGTGGWEPATRPLITTNGNAQGTVVNKTADDDGTLIPYREFQPKIGDAQGDLWASTPADPNYVVAYEDAAGTPQTTTCPSGCLLFYPGTPTTHRKPLLVGTSGWATTITGLF